MFWIKLQRVAEIVFFVWYSKYKNDETAHRDWLKCNFQQYQGLFNGILYEPVAISI